MRKADRERLIDRVITATAKKLGKTVSDEDREDIKQSLSKRGRPARDGWTDEQDKQLDRVGMMVHRGLSINAAAQMVAKENPGHSQEATARWLKRHFSRYHDNPGWKVRFERRQADLEAMEKEARRSKKAASRGRWKE